ncbi:MAG: dephospho-CoA kinase [Candidatus Marinimicrobia bacterium]|jgi:dephospho-CoA kinase|nr:dephospho-CoA kinase [Gammaproteobacteria bacterium]MBT4317347.1 dephospho-CoA kinase [Candidatus Neomarinimicrobiota bacterium]MBT4707102.1 dephospho-CoA kinase [Candidatus Neomarinimicrobiota bacterium]MBT4926437.1 dephospho-CoA kinase [Candidatus Neomarinimicrobiota bacterium]MBT5251604.1 dephospho-CoA kinase [Candidatus Neomarinimicrobiota bacterium]
MIIVGITGGIASGKSTVSKIFQQEHDAYVFDADKEAKRLLLNKEISEKILHTFPDLQDTDPLSMSKVVFKNEDNQKKLNAILHPAVNAELLKRIESIGHEKKYPIFVVDAALIIEGGSYKYYHESGAYIILLISSEAKRIQRALSRGNLSEESIKERMDLQWDDDKKKDYVDYILENNDSLDKLKSSITFLVKEIRENAKIS